MARTVVYIYKDIERALIAQPSSAFHIICADSVYAQSVKQTYPEFIHILSGNFSDTYDLLTHPETLSILKTLTRPEIIVFKPNTRIETWCDKEHYPLLNQSSEKSRKLEDKISQTQWLDALNPHLLPPHQIGALKSFSWNGTPSIVQFNTGHTGNGTLIVNSEKELQDLIAKFPERIVRKSAIINGPSYTVNAVISNKEFFVGPLMYQITGLAPFTDLPFATVGNDWSLPESLGSAEKKMLQNSIEQIAQGLIEFGWQGCFGIDFVVDEINHRVYVIELNMRQTASVSYESELQKGGLTTGEAHLKALLREKIEGPIAPAKPGAQIVQRNTKNISSLSPESITTINALEGVTRSISYSSTEHNDDCLRIQTAVPLMKKHGVLNELGEKIKSVVTSTHA